jgi:hypothetical protein
VIGLLLLLLLSSSDALALTLPNPPDRSAPTNNQNGPLQSTNMQSFAGGVSLVKDGSSDQNVSTNEFIASFFCATGSFNLAKQYRSEIGESISGPISNDQASGIAEAMKSVGPPTTVSLPMTLSGSYGGNLTYFLTGITYNVTTYSVWTTTQQSPAEQRVGHIVVSVPTQPQVGRTFEDLAGAFCPAIGKVGLGAGFGSDPWAWLSRPLAQISTPPDNGVAPIITYGTMRVLSSAGVAGVARIRAGENATFLLPPGTYSAVADVVLFGIPFSVGSGTYSSSGGATDAQFTVSLTGVENIWYALEVSAVIILVAVILVIAWKLHLRANVVKALPRVKRVLRSWWDALLRETQREGEFRSWLNNMRLQAEARVPCEGPHIGHRCSTQSDGSEMRLRGMKTGGVVVASPHSF